MGSRYRGGHLSWPGLSRPSRLGEHCVPYRDRRDKPGDDKLNLPPAARVADANFIWACVIAPILCGAGCAVVCPRIPGGRAVDLATCEGDGAPTGATSFSCAPWFPKVRRLSARHRGVVSASGPRFRRFDPPSASSSRPVLVPAGGARCRPSARGTFPHARGRRRHPRSRSVLQERPSPGWLAIGIYRDLYTCVTLCYP